MLPISAIEIQVQEEENASTEQGAAKRLSKNPKKCECLLGLTIIGNRQLSHSAVFIRRPVVVDTAKCLDNTEFQGFSFPVLKISMLGAPVFGPVARKIEVTPGPVKAFPDALK